MASRGGKMVAGTDGMDFTHRERVADQYSVSASNKSRLKLLAITHLLLGVVHNIRLLPFLLTLVGVKFPAIPLLKLLPSPSEVEYAWLASLPFVFMALSAIKRSKSGPLQVFQLVVLLCCISSSCFTLFLMGPDTLQFLLSGSVKGSPELFGLPFSVLWSVFLLFCLIVHTGELIVCRTLVRAWAPRHGKRQ